MEREMAAVLVCGEGSGISHRTAAALWKMLPLQEPGAPVDVSIQRNGRIKAPSLRIHRMSFVHPDERTVEKGIPVTIPARTLLDLAGVASSRELEQAVAMAKRELSVGGGELERLLERYPKRAGASRLRMLLEREGEPALARSEAESRFLGLVRRAKLTRPDVNVRVKAYEVDFLWPRERVVVEIDGFAFHSSRDSFEQDRHRDAVLAASGFLVLRVTWRQITEEPEAVLVLLAQALARAAGPG